MPSTTRKQILYRFGEVVRVRYITTYLMSYDNFVENFLDDNKRLANKFAKYADGEGEDATIEIEAYYTDHPHPCMCNMYWRIPNVTEWNNKPYNTSSCFALFMCNFDE